MCWILAVFLWLLFFTLWLFTSVLAVILDKVVLQSLQNLLLKGKCLTAKECPNMTPEWVDWGLWTPSWSAFCTALLYLSWLGSKILQSPNPLSEEPYQRKIFTWSNLYFLKTQEYDIERKHSVSCFLLYLLYQGW